MFGKKNKPGANVPTANIGALKESVEMPTPKVESVGGKQERSILEIEQLPLVAQPSRPKLEHLPGPRDIAQAIGGILIVQYKADHHLVWPKFKMVVRPRQDSKHVYDFRIFNKDEIAAKKIKVKDFTTFDTHPELILYEGAVEDPGWPRNPKVHIEKKGKAEAISTMPVSEPAITQSKK